MARENFAQPVKDALAERAGHRCSFPDCDNVTVGPSAEGATAISRTGMACHIYAASDGPAARRVASKMDPEFLRSFENGIWMCFTHGKLIDTDEATYTPELLLFWRHLAEWRADLRQRRGADVQIPPAIEAGKSLPPLSKTIDIHGGAESKLHEAFHDSCLADVWDRDLVHTVREFVAELALNSLDHGRAARITLTIEWDRVVITDDGGQFSPFELLTSPKGQGGAAAAASLLDDRLGEVVVTHTFESRQNRTTIGFLRSAIDVKDFTHCFVEIKSDLDREKGFLNAELFCESHEECEIVYVLARNLSHSYVKIMKDHLSTLPSGQKIVLLGGSMSSSLLAYFKKAMPSLTIGKLPS